MKYRIALAGNPNSGKTTLFNKLTGSNQFVGNWPGVTVEKKTGLICNNKEIEIIDLPGVYSLSTYTLEEKVAKKFLIEEKPDVILNIVDGTNLERSLYLTTQLMELGIPVVVAVNMFDTMEKKGNSLNLQKLENALGCRAVNISAINGTGVNVAIDLAIHKDNLIWKNNSISFDESISEDEATSKRYEFIDKIVMDSLTINKKNGKTATEKIDEFLTNRWLALPIFAVIMFMVYFISITIVGGPITDWVNDVFFGEIVTNGATDILTSISAAPWLIGLIVDGVIAGVGGVLGFLPQLLMLFFLLAILEGSGYMARVAFILDRIFSGFGLSGKSFIPMLIGTGCSVPGIMASRTIENHSERKMTIITTSFIPCSAKLPIIALIAASVFDGAWWVAPSGYFIGISAVLVSGLILKKTKMFAGEQSPFIMELPDYHMPTLTNLLKSTWDRGWSFVKKAGTIILLSSMAIWFLSNFGWVDGKFEMVSDLSQGLLASVGSVIAVVFAPLGFGTWEATVATITGLIAKENIVGTLGVLYGSVGIGSQFTSLAAYSFMTFNLLCVPCFAAVGAISREMNNKKWTLFAIAYQTGFAYLVAFLINNAGKGYWIGVIVIIIVIKLIKDKKDHKGCSGNCGSCSGCGGGKSYNSYSKKTDCNR